MPAKSISVTQSFDAVIDALVRYSEGEGMPFEQVPIQNGARIRLLASPPVGLNVYPSKGGGCKVVFDNPDTATAEAIVALLDGKAVASRDKTVSDGLSPAVSGANEWVGSDESGKGDYFGPMVIAAVAVTTTNWRALDTIGVQDSKKLTDARAAALARELREAFPNEVVAIMPPRYNELWSSFGNVNRLLAWGHARAIENVLAKAPDATVAIADQFGEESLIREALFKRGRQVDLVQMPRAETDPAVAAASVLARAEFVRRLDTLSRDAGIKLPKGASAAVEAAARTLVAKLGRDALHKYAKEHFKTTERVVRPRMV